MVTLLIQSVSQYIRWGFIECEASEKFVVGTTI